jgi:hypothetical protein
MENNIFVQKEEDLETFGRSGTLINKSILMPKRDVFYNV